MNISELFVNVAGVDVSYSDFDFDAERPFVASRYEYDLKEDLFQANYKNYTIDIGWYPSFDLDGEFQVRIIKSGNWEEPIYKEVFVDIFSVADAVKEMLTKI